MTAITVREFSYNPSAIFSRVESGEIIEVTRHGKVIAVLTPPSHKQSRYDKLAARGLIKPAPSGLTAGDSDKFTRIDVPDHVDPLALLLDGRDDAR